MNKKYEEIRNKDKEIEVLRTAYTEQSEELEKEKNDRISNGVAAIMILVLAVGGLITMCIYYSDNIDKHTIGTFLCEKNGATLKSVDFDIDGNSGKLSTFKVVCTRSNEVPIEDHYLYITGRE